MVRSYNQIKQGRKGFTIVELLIVIVVIGILAAITVVAYSGITSRARTTKAQTAAANVQKVAEAYNADNGYYPSTIANFTTGSLSTKLPSGLTILGVTPSGTNGESAVWYQSCGATNPPAAATAVTGGRIQYWDFSTGFLSTTIVYVGTGQATIGAAPCFAWTNAT